MNFGTKSELHALRGLLSRQLFPLCVLIAIATLLWSRADEIDLRAAIDAFHAIPPMAWATAAALTALSFWSFGQIEAVAHRLAGTNLPDAEAARGGIVAVALSQFLGFGILTGTLARWRVFPTLGLATAARVTLTTSLAFMAALALLTALALFVVPLDIPYGRPIAATVLALLCVGLAILIWPPRALLHMRRPPMKAFGHIFALTCVDTVAASLALFVLLPADAAPEIFVFYAAFLVAIASGLLGTTPGGIGPFEFVLLAALGTTDQAALLSAILGFRLIYFAIPAVLAGVAFVIGRPKRSMPCKMSVPQIVPPLPEQMIGARRAETALARQGRFGFLTDTDSSALLLAAPTAQAIVALGDPLRLGQESLALDALERSARHRDCFPGLYKCGARLAARARQRGWQVLRVSQEAVISVDAFDLATPDKRQLRRMLRKAEKAGVEIRAPKGQLPLDAMQRIAEDWEKTQAGARGFSMGRFDRDYVAGQRVFLAYKHGDLIGFATFHEARDELCLDLLCRRHDAPCGTTHALVEAAIAASRVAGIGTLSLAAAPEDAPVAETRVARTAARLTGAPGLRRFKESFGPHWRNLYLAAPSGAAMGLVAVDLADEISRPRISSSQIDNLYRDYEFD